MCGLLTGKGAAAAQIGRAKGLYAQCALSLLAIRERTQPFRGWITMTRALREKQERFPSGLGSNRNN